MNSDICSVKFLTADYIFSAHTGFIPDGVLVLEDDNTVREIWQSAEGIAELQKFSGVIAPGFVNAHCHLELSHLRGQIQKHTGFSGFAKELIGKRMKFSEEEIRKAIIAAEEEMKRNGIIAVGDISNTLDTFEPKRKHKLRYHTFIELIALKPEAAGVVFNAGKELRNNCPQDASLAPHAPYSVSAELLELIAVENRKRFSPTSLHSEESPAEDEFSKTGTGPLREFYTHLGLDISWYKAPGKNSLRATLPHLRNDENLLLVHNTLTSAEDIRWAESQHSRLWWCFCPNANLYIENRLPEFENFHRAGVHITVGTDSLASNDQLDILSELKIIHQAAPKIPVSELLTWSTKNGAEFLKFDDLGTFEKGKKPGVNLLTGVTPESIAPQAGCRELRT